MGRVREEISTGGNRNGRRGEVAMCEVQVREVISRWMTEYLGQEHAQMPRPGAVCPFVKPALDAGTIRIRAVSTTDRHCEGIVLEAARRALAEFADVMADDAKQARGALVVAFPDLIDRAHLIDDAHGIVKDEAVEAGLMIGQFHAECPEPSARNPLFAVNRSPIPLLAIRAMTVHDILFLHGCSDWFRAYERRFGHLYRGRRRMDPAFRTLFDEATARLRHPAAEAAVR